jgi:hypothetical protein
LNGAKSKEANMKSRVGNFALVGLGFLAGALTLSTFVATAQNSAASVASVASVAQVTAQQANCQTFTQTGHKVCGRFLAYWNEHGALAQQGYPLSEEFVETSRLDGKPYTVQYFERAVFEYHPENQPPYDVLLSQLGTYLGKSMYTEGFPSSAGTVPFYEDRRTGPTEALVSFYNAISRKEYERAYSYFRGAPNPNPSLAAPYDQWVKGYANTKTVSVAVGKVVQDAGAGNIYAAFPVVLFATQSDDSLQLYTGCYTMHRANTGISEDPNDELWSIDAADLHIIPDRPYIDGALAQTCSR